jgi:hypothetical protein
MMEVTIVTEAAEASVPAVATEAIAMRKQMKSSRNWPGEKQ